jgi:hypothetical protein
MILFELRCDAGHHFEAWFRNGDTYDSQAAAREIPCPQCGNVKVAKAPMAPRIAKSRGSQEGRSGDTPAGDRQPVAVPAEQTARQTEFMAKLRELRQQVESNCDYVGGRFAEEARKIFYGEVESRAIYGETTPGEAEELRDEGVPFAAIPWAPTHNS